MTLVAILACLVLQRFVNVGGWFNFSWFEMYLKSFGNMPTKLDHRLAVILVFAPILVLLLLLHFVFVWRLFGIFDFLLAVSILLVCVDARDLRHKLEGYFAGLDGSDLHAASNAVSDLISDTAIGNMSELHRAVTKGILLGAFEKFFVGIFWFMLLNIYGLSFYFIMTLLHRYAERINPGYVGIAKLAGQIQNCLDWLPARLLGFSYALVGNFNKGFGYCTRNLWSGLGNTKNFAIESGLAALDVEAQAVHADQVENRMALELIDRALIIWIMLLFMILMLRHM